LKYALINSVAGNSGQYAPIYVAVTGLEIEFYCAASKGHSEDESTS